MGILINIPYQNIHMSELSVDIMHQSELKNVFISVMETNWALF